MISLNPIYFFNIAFIPAEVQARIASVASCWGKRQLYTGKFSISVVDLKHINLATEEDRAKHRDLWARFFKAGSWEDLKMLAQQDTDIQKAVTMVHKLSQDEAFRMKCWAREDFIRHQIDQEVWFNAEIKKREAVLAEMDAEIAEIDSAIAEKDAVIAKKDATIAKLKKQLETRKNLRSE